MPEIVVPCASVRPEWVDYNGHMNVGYYAIAFDQAIDALMERVDLDASYVRRTNHGMFALQSSYHHLGEMLLNEEFSISAQVVARDSKRLHVLMIMHRSADGELIAICEQILIHVDLETRKSSPFNAPALAAIDAFSGSQGVLCVPDAALRSMRINETLGQILKAVQERPFIN